MKIAIPTRNNEVDDHFGHCEAYTVFTIGENKNVVNIETLPSPQGCGCKSNIASVLQEQGVSVLLAGSMGAGALNVLNNHGIKVFRGNSGSVKKLTEAYLLGFITDSGKGCDSHDNHHGNGGDHVCEHNAPELGKKSGSGFSLA
jgi:predicted Fe-Mo cluster-binding NifX family protein